MNIVAYRAMCVADRPNYLVFPGTDTISNVVDQARKSGVTYSLGSGALVEGPGPFGLGKSIKFGAGDVISSAGGIGLADTITMECWVRRVGTGGVNALIGVASGGSGNFYIRFNGSGFDSIKSGAVLLQTATRPVTDTDQFHHLVGVKDGAVVRAYIDGADFTGSISAATCGALPNISLNADQGERGSHYLAAVAVYDHELSRDRVIAHYRAGRGLVAARARTGMRR